MSSLGWSIPQSTKQAAPLKTQSNVGKIDKHCTNCGMMNYNVETCKKMSGLRWQPHKHHNQVKNHKRHLHMHATSMV